ncbi:hypothetical protein BESB_004410 [Besnoitia besnoiti]|uniref:RAP domain-containing protein n=1 Tax=Besnoitia besnoiti TaxID=94643 RepID=A0A2A9MQ64_BESBE|nr:hypothetical protein BESB_004410 [Besnoitia besnoiti]PFH38100.1 hypothetical protein BESB_004410 [Besnoitia besnoiti]
MDPLRGRAMSQELVRFLLPSGYIFLREHHMRTLSSALSPAPTSSFPFHPLYPSATRTRRVPPLTAGPPSTASRTESSERLTRDGVSRLQRSADIQRDSWLEAKGGDSALPYSGRRGTWTRPAERQEIRVQWRLDAGRRRRQHDVGDGAEGGSGLHTSTRDRGGGGVVAPRHPRGLHLSAQSLDKFACVQKRSYQSDRQRAAAEAQLEKREAAVHAPRSFGQLYEPRTAQSKKVHKRWVKEVPFYLQPAVAERNALLKSQRGAQTLQGFRSRSSPAKPQAELPLHLARIFEHSRDPEAAAREDILFTLLRLLSGVRIGQKAARQKSARAGEASKPGAAGGEQAEAGTKDYTPALAIPGLDAGNLDALDRRIMECIDAWTAPDLGLLLVTRQELRDCLSHSRGCARGPSLQGASPLPVEGYQREALNKGEDESVTRALVRRLVSQRGQAFSQYASLYALQAFLHLAKAREERRRRAGLQAHRTLAERAHQLGEEAAAEEKRSGNSAYAEGERMNLLAGRGVGCGRRGAQELQEIENEAFADAEMINVVIKRVGRNMASCDLEVLARIVHLLSSLPTPPTETLRRVPRGGGPEPARSSSDRRPARAGADAASRRRLEPSGGCGTAVAEESARQSPTAADLAESVSSATVARDLPPLPSSRKPAGEGEEGSEATESCSGEVNRGAPESGASGFLTERTPTTFLADRNAFLYAVATHVFATAFTEAERNSASETASNFAAGLRLALPSTASPPFASFPAPGGGVSPGASSPPGLGSVAGVSSPNSPSSCPAPSASPRSRSGSSSSATPPLWVAKASRGGAGVAVTGDRSWTYSRLSILLTGLTRTGVVFPPLFYALKPMIVALRLQFPPPMLASLLVAYASLGAADETGCIDLFGTLGRELVKGVRDMDVGVVGVAANAFANAGVLHQEFFKVVGEVFPARMPLCSPRLIGMLANTYLRLGLYDDDLVPSLFHCASQRLSECDWHTLALLLQASTKIGSANSCFSRQAADVVCHAIERENPQHPAKSQARELLTVCGSSGELPGRHPLSPKVSFPPSAERAASVLLGQASSCEERSLTRARWDSASETQSGDQGVAERSIPRLYVQGELTSASAFVICYAVAKAKDLLGTKCPDVSAAQRALTRNLSDGEEATGAESCVASTGISHDEAETGSAGQPDVETIWQLLLATELVEAVTRFIPQSTSFTEVANTAFAVAKFVDLADNEAMVSEVGERQRGEGESGAEELHCDARVKDEERCCRVDREGRMPPPADAPGDRTGAREGAAAPSAVRAALTTHLLATCAAFFQVVETHLGCFRTLKHASLGPPERDNVTAGGRRTIRRIPRRERIAESFAPKLGDPGPGSGCDAAAVVYVASMGRRRRLSSECDGVPEQDEQAFLLKQACAWAAREITWSLMLLLRVTRVCPS